MTTNYDPEDPVRRARGLTGSYAGGAQVIVADGTTEVDAFQITVAGGTVEEIADGVAQITFGGGTGPSAGDLGAVGASADLDLSLYHVFIIVLTTNVTLTFSNPPISGVEGEWYVVLVQGGSGSYTATWPGTVVWQDSDGTDGAAAPTLYTAVGAEDPIVITTVDGGASYGGAREFNGLIVKDEGTALGAFGTTLDFVGAGVTASGTGPVKTITIAGGASGAAGGDLSGTYPNPTIVPSAVTAIVGDRHIHIVDEQFDGDASTTVFVLANSAAPDSVMAWVAGARTPVTLGGTLNDEITFGSAPGSGTANISVDYAAVLS